MMAIGPFFHTNIVVKKLHFSKKFIFNFLRKAHFYQRFMFKWSVETSGIAFEVYFSH